MKRIALALITVALLALSACAPAASSRSESPHIIVTTNILGDVVAAIVGSEAQVTTLMKPNADPHSFEISAREAAQLSAASLIVSNGLGLEEGLSQHLDRAAHDGAEVFVASDFIERLSYADHDQAGTADPHWWTDPARMRDVVDALETALVDVDGIDGSVIRSQADSYRAELTQLDADMTSAFASIDDADRALVTNHHVFGYLAERFDFRIVGAVIPGGTTLASPSAADLRELATAITDAGVSSIFAESSQPDRLVQVLASEANLNVNVIELFTESLTAPGEGADTYLTMMRANTERITQGLTR